MQTLRIAMFVTAATVWMSAGVVLAQAPPPADPAADTPALQEGLAPPPPTPPVAEGDIIVLKSGKEMRGVQVLRENSRQVIVEVMPGVEPLVLPRSLVQSVMRDDYEPSGRGSTRGSRAEEGPPNFIYAEAVSPGLNKVLKQPLSEDPLVFEGESLVEVLQALSQRVSLPLQFTDDVSALPTEQLQWTVTVPPRTSFWVVLYQYVQPNFPQLSVRFESDRIVVGVAASGGEPPSSSEGEGVAAPPDAAAAGAQTDTTP